MQILLSTVALLLALVSPAARAADNPSDAFQKGLLEEEASQNLDAAIRQYQSVLNQFADQRRIAAAATFRLGECYRKLGRTAEARAQFERVVREFSDQAALASLSQRYLTSGGGFNTGVHSADLLNIDFTAHLAPAHRTKQGPAAIGQNASDVWNEYSRDVSSASDWRESGQVTNLLWTDGSPSPISVSVTNAGGAWGTDSADPMLQTYLYPLSRQGEITVQLDGVPPGRYWLCFYAHGQPPEENAVIQVVSAGTIVAQIPTSNSADWSNRPWMPGKQFALFDFEAAAGKPIVILVKPGESGLAVMNGLQLLKVLPDGRMPASVHWEEGGHGLASSTQSTTNPEQVKLLREEIALVEQQLDTIQRQIENGHASSADRDRVKRDLLSLQRKLPENAAPTQQRALIEEEIRLAQKALDECRKRIQVGQATSMDEIPLKRDLLQLQRDLLAVQATAAPRFQNRLNQIVRRAEAPTDEEAKEVERIQEIIQNSPDLINARKDGRTPLQQAASKGQLVVARFLLDNRAEVNAKSDVPDRSEKTALHFAAQAGHKAMVELLLARGAQVDARDWAGHTPLHLAAGQGYQAVAQVLLQNGADPNAKDEELGSTPLVPALFSRSSAMVELLLTNKAEVNVQDSSDRTPLMRAVETKQLALVELLLNRQADINAKANDGHTALTVSIKVGSDPVTQLLLNRGADPNVKAGFNIEPNVLESCTPLIYAVRTGKSTLVELLLARRAEVNAQDPLGRTPLRWAVAQENVPIVQFLLSKGANPNLSDKEGTTPLAANLGVSPSKRALPARPEVRQPLSRTRVFLNDAQRKIFDQLLAHGAEVNIAETGHAAGSTPLLKAIELGDTNVVEVLLAHKAELNRATQTSVTPLMQAANFADSTLVSLFLAKGADINGEGLNGYTALHVAAASGDTNILQLLLMAGADPNLEDDAGNTPLHYAAFYGWKPAVQMLLDRGAKLDITNHSGITPLDAAGETVTESPTRALGRVPELVRRPGAYRALDQHNSDVREFLRKEIEKRRSQ